MDKHPINALSPLDGRYHTTMVNLSQHFSEKSLIWHRLFIEIKWLKFLASHKEFPECPPMPNSLTQELDDLLANFSNSEALAIKAIEMDIHHDVKAVENFIGQHCSKHILPYKPWIHFACTSDDINNLAYSLMIKKSMQDCVIPGYIKIIKKLNELAEQSIDIPMISLTHGQAASTTTLGKELAVFIYRSCQQLTELAQSRFLGKFNGAVGNFNAHMIAYPDLDWWEISRTFVETELKLTWNPVTTQIEPHDFIAIILNHMTHLNSILLDMSVDFWTYISRNYFILQKDNANHVGSSTMPHKINPIHFENAEGNLGLCNALAQHMALKLTRSRLQRDLSDSTVMRNIGSCFGYALLSCQQLHLGLAKLMPNPHVMHEDLNNHWEILAEPIQTLMRKQGIDDGYDILKDLTQGCQLDQEKIKQIIESEKIPLEIKSQLHSLSPHEYTGDPHQALRHAQQAMDQVISSIESVS